ncbi:MAG: hypothetical protein KF830_10930 [Planctomycetes bacterium]|nr:hypothetical protein [Planctomycetota bacterium]
MDLAQAVRDVLEGSSLREVAAAFRADLIAHFGFRPEEVTAATFRAEADQFMRKLARHLGDRHAGEPRVGEALRQWVGLTDHYEAWDALLSGFTVEGREALVRRGRVMFPGPLTAHWTDG